MLRRTLAVTALALVSACARRPLPGPSTLHLDPGEGTLSVRDVSTGGERVCATECRESYPAGTRLELELAWPRPEGIDRATSRLTVAGDRSIRGEWIDRSGLRALGVVVLVLGGGGGLGLLGWGVALGSSHDADAGSRVAAGFLGGFIGFIGAAIAGVAIGFGSYLVGLRDHAEIRIGPLRDAHVTLAPTEGGATLTFDARF